MALYEVAVRAEEGGEVVVSRTIEAPHVGGELVVLMKTWLWLHAEGFPNYTHVVYRQVYRRPNVPADTEAPDAA